MVVDLGFQRVQVHGFFGKPHAQIPNLGGSIRVRSIGPYPPDDFVELPFDGCLVRRLILRQGRLHLRQQVPFQKLRHLGALRVHDAIEPEVQIRPVELEQLFQQRDQLVE